MKVILCDDCSPWKEKDPAPFLRHFGAILSSSMQSQEIRDSTAGAAVGSAEGAGPLSAGGSRHLMPPAPFFFFFLLFSFLFFFCIFILIGLTKLSIGPN